MKVLEAIAARRSVKHYRPGLPMPEADVTRLLEAGRFAPSSFNIQHGRIVRVRDPLQRQRLREAAWDQAQVTEASELWVLCADIQAWQKAPERYWREATPGTQDRIVPMLLGFYADRPQLQRDEALRSIGILGQTLMLAARSMGYDSCPMIGFDAEAVAHIVNLPSDHVVGMMLALGQAAAPAQPRGGQLPLSELVFADRFA